MTKNSTENKFYLITMFFNMDFQRSLFVLYLLQVGFSEGEIGVFQAALFFSNVLFEIPSGLFADRYGRRPSLIAGFLGMTLNGIGFILFSSFLPFLFLFVLYGISSAMSSGADRALLYDNLAAEGRRSDYVKIIARARSIGALTLGASILVGGFLYEGLGWTGVYLIFAIAKFLGAVIAASLPERRSTSSDDDQLNCTPDNDISPGRGALLWSFYRARDGRALLVLFTCYGLFEMATVPVYIYGQTLFANDGLSIPVIAAVYSAVELITAVMFLASARIADRFSVALIASLTTAVVAALLLFLSLNPGPAFSITAFLLVMSLPAFYETAYDVYINNSMMPSIRASGLSVANLVNALAIGTSYAFFGGIMENLGYGVALQAVAALSIIGLMGALITLNYRARTGDRRQALEYK